MISGDIREAVVRALRNTPSVHEVVEDKVYGNPDNTARMPYIQVLTSGFQTSNDIGINRRFHFLQISAFSETKHFTQIENLVDAIAESLHEADLDIPSGHVVARNQIVAKFGDGVGDNEKFGTVEVRLTVEVGS